MCGSPEAQLAALIEEAGRHGLAREPIAARLGCAPLPSGPPLVDDHVLALETQRVLAAITDFEALHPGERGMPISSLRLQLLEERVLAVLGDAGAIVRDGSLVRSAGRDLGAVRAAASERARALLAQIEQAGLTGLEEKALAEGRDARALREDLGALEADERIVRVAGTCLDARALQRLAEAAAADVTAKGTLPVSWTKDYAGVSRKHAMVLWTHLDRLGVTQRKGDARVAGPRAPKLAAKQAGRT